MSEQLQVFGFCGESALATGSHQQWLLIAIFPESVAYGFLAQFGFVVEKEKKLHT